MEFHPSVVVHHPSNALCRRWCSYPLVLLHIVQMGFLTNAQIEKFLPLATHWVSLSLEWRSRLVLLSPPQVVTVQLCDGYLNGDAGRMLQFSESVTFLLEFVDLALVGQQVVVLEVLMQIDFVELAVIEHVLVNLTWVLFRWVVMWFFRGVAEPHTVCGCLVGPPCGHSSPASWSCPAPPPGSWAPSDSCACIHTGWSGNGAATWSCPAGNINTGTA